MTDVSCWRVAAWNFAVLAVAGVATLLVGVDPLIAGWEPSRERCLAVPSGLASRVDRCVAV